MSTAVVTLCPFVSGAPADVPNGLRFTDVSIACRDVPKQQLVWTKLGEKPYRRAALSARHGYPLDPVRLAFQVDDLLLKFTSSADGTSNLIPKNLQILSLLLDAANNLLGRWNLTNAPCALASITALARRHQIVNPIVPSVRDRNYMIHGQFHAILSCL